MVGIHEKRRKRVGNRKIAKRFLTKFGKSQEIFCGHFHRQKYCGKQKNAD